MISKKITPPDPHGARYSSTYPLIFQDFRKHVNYVSMDYLDANFHGVIFKNGDFLGKSVFFSDFRKSQFTQITILQKVHSPDLLLLLRFSRFFDGTGLNQILLKFHQ